MSQSKAKYMSVLQTAHQGLWIRRLLIELGLKHIIPDPTIISLTIAALSISPRIPSIMITLNILTFSIISFVNE